MNNPKKYLGTVLQDWKIIDSYRVNPYKKAYAGKTAVETHNAYNYVLRNLTTNECVTLSGNSVRRVFNQNASLNDVISNKQRNERAKIRREMNAV